MNGYSGGILTSVSGGILTSVDSAGAVSHSAIQNEAGDPTDITVKTSAETNKVLATFLVSNSADITQIIGDDDIGAFGSSVDSTGDSLFVDDFSLGAISDNSTNTAIVSQFVLNSEAYMFSLDETAVLPAPSNVTLCDCDFLTWGFWGLTADLSGGDTEHLHLAQWVAGEVANFSDINALSATAVIYMGHAVGTVNNNGDIYTALGNANMNFDFSDPTNSTLLISDFDGGSFFLDKSAPNGGTGDRMQIVDVGGLNTFSNVTNDGLKGQGAHVGVDGNVLGSFMKGGGSFAAEAGAHWEANNNSDYEVNGIIAAATANAP